MNQTNNLPRIITPIVSSGTGMALATTAHDEWIKIAGIIISALSLLLPIVQNLLARRNPPPPPPAP